LQKLPLLLFAVVVVVVFVVLIVDVIDVASFRFPLVKRLLIVAFHKEAASRFVRTLIIYFM
jgi:hypothetical protein